MKIDIKRVLDAGYECLKDERRLRATMNDLYPEQTRDRNLLMNVFSSGIVNELQRSKSIDEMLYNKYLLRLINEYGIEKTLAKEALDEWIGALIGKDTVANICKPSNVYENERLLKSKSFMATLENKKKVSNNIDLHNRDESTIEKSVSPKANAVNKKPNKKYTKPIAAHAKNNGKPYLEFSVIRQGDTIVIGKYLGQDTDEIVIPEYIDGLKVIGIGKNAFKGLKNLRKVHIEGEIYSIGEAAFSECNCLECINLSDEINAIGKKAFFRTSIKELILPRKMKFIEEATFAECKKLEKIILPDATQEIRKEAFLKCDRLRNVACNHRLRKIGVRAFYMSGLRNISLNEGLEEIEGGAFDNCKYLKQLFIPHSILKLGIDDLSRRICDENTVVHIYKGSKSESYFVWNNLNYCYIAK